jgi:hypothetical protein
VTAPAVQLSEEQLDALADRLAARLAPMLRAPEPTRAAGMVDAAELAAELRVSRTWVYAHRGDLGAVRLGGPNGRLRFDLQAARAAAGRIEAHEPPPPPPKRSRRPRRAPTAGRVLRSRAAGVGS